MSVAFSAGALFDASAGIVVAVLLTSATAKFLTPSRARHAILNFGFGAKLAQFGQVALPILEVAIAIAILVSTGAIQLFSTLAALCLFVVFTVLIWREVLRGRSFDCGCFGAFSRSPIDKFTVVRNIGLTFLSALSICRFPQREPLISAFSEPEGIVIWICIAVIGLCAAITGAFVHERRHIRILRAALNEKAHEQFPDTVSGEGDPVPEVEIVSRDGIVTRLKGDYPHGARLVFFVKTGCGACRAVEDNWDRWKGQLGDAVAMIALTSSQQADVRTKYPALFIDSYYGAQASRRALGVRMLPSAVLLGSNGVVSTKVAEGTEQISALVTGTIDAVAEASAP